MEYGTEDGSRLGKVSLVVVLAFFHILFAALCLARMRKFEGVVRTCEALKMSVTRVLVYGGKGALGSTVVSTFKAKNWVMSCTDRFTMHACIILPRQTLHTHTPFTPYV